MAKDLDGILEDQRTQEEIEEAALNKRNVEKEDFKWLMMDIRGRRFVWRYLEKAGVFRVTFRADSNEGDFLEGMRNMGLMLMVDINEICPEKYQLMVNENRNENNA